jgi:3',5'-cyclic AMP phosphodiesterase CpdA
MTFRIAQISDTHLSDDKTFFVENFLRVGDALKDSKPDLVLNSGDISLDGAASESDLVAARRLHDALGLPTRFLPGNHDLGDCQDAPGHHESPIDAGRRARYMRHFGPDWWTFDVPGWRLIGINAQLVGSDLPEAEAQHDAIADAAATLAGRRLALFLHKPLFDSTVDETVVTGRFVNPVPRRLLLADLGGTIPALIACGHVHQYRETWPADTRPATRHVWATSTAFVIPDRKRPRYGVKETGYVEHALHSDGTHDSRLVRVPGLPNHDIADFPGAYGPI